MAKKPNYTSVDRAEVERYTQDLADCHNMDFFVIQRKRSFSYVSSSEWLSNRGVTPEWKREGWERIAKVNPSRHVDDDLEEHSRNLTAQVRSHEFMR